MSPNVLGVGGTSLTLTNGNYGSETVWNNQYGKSGGGLSTIESRPTFQNGVADVVGTQRGAPDVAFDADPLTGVDVFRHLQRQSFDSLDGARRHEPRRAGVGRSHCRRRPGPRAGRPRFARRRHANAADALQFAVRRLP